MLRRSVRPTLVLMVIVLALSACASMTPQVRTPAATATTVPQPTATVTPMPTSTTAAPVSFTCPEAAAGTQKIFADSTIGLRFSYPATWTERNCVRTATASDAQTILVGNLFFVTVMPRNGLTIRQWVEQQVDSQNEQVTLAPLTVTHATEAVTIHVTSTPNADPSKPFDREPFAQTSAIVAGSQQFYVVNPLTAQLSMTDTIPSLSRDQLTQQVITTFDVP